MHIRQIQRSYDPYDIIVIEASAGGVEALLAWVSDLPIELPTALLVVTHMPAAVSIGQEHRYVCKPSSAPDARR